jgi:hypothetical protein
MCARPGVSFIPHDSYRLVAGRDKLLLQNGYRKLSPIALACASAEAMPARYCDLTPER